MYRNNRSRPKGQRTFWNFDSEKWPRLICIGPKPIDRFLHEMSKV